MNLFLSHDSVKSALVAELHNAPAKRSVLVDTICAQLKVSKQAVYKILRELQRQRVIVVAENTVSLHTYWIESLEFWLVEARKNMARSGIISAIIALTPNKKITYHFPSLRLMEISWEYILTFLFSHTQTPTDFFTYEHYNWVIHHDMYDSELATMDQLKKYHHRYFITVGNATKLEKLGRAVYKKHGNVPYTLLQNNLAIPKDQTFNVFGDYALTMRLPKGLYEKIRKVFFDFENGDKTYEHVRSEFESLANQKGNASITIEYKTKRTESYRAKVKKYFL